MERAFRATATLTACDPVTSRRARLLCHNSDLWANKGAAPSSPPIAPDSAAPFADRSRDTHSRQQTSCDYHRLANGTLDIAGNFMRRTFP